MQEVKTLQEFQALPEQDRMNAYFPERDLDGIEICDNGEKLVDLKEFFAAQNIPVIFASVWGDMLPARLRGGAAERLVYAAQSLLPEYLLMITDTFRPISFQRQQFESARSEVLKAKPYLQFDPDQLYYETTKYSADPEGCPPHLTGGTLDLTLARADGQEVNMGTPVDTISELAQTFHQDIGPEAREQRERLFHAMTRYEFVNLPTEWWHYSYGDQYWAAFWKRPCAVYGKIEEVPEKR